MKPTHVTVRVREVGDHFGCVGQVVSSRSRRVLATTRLYPYGFDGTALAAAKHLALKRGYRLSEQD